MKDQLYNFYILHQRKYKENSIIASIFTPEFGKISALIRTTKKTSNLYQPLVKLRGQIGFSKKTDGLSKVYNIEFVKFFYQKTYINLLSLQYINELMYLLLSYSHEEIALFNKYDFILKNINDNNYKYLLRIFELELLESLGQGIYVDCDVDSMPIENNCNYTILPNGFKKTLVNGYNTIIGKNLLKISQPVDLWSKDDLKAISQVLRVYIDFVLAGKQLESRKLLLDYLRLIK